MPDSEVTVLRTPILALRDFMNSRILGQQRLISRMLVSLLADGHILVEGHVAYVLSLMKGYDTGN